MASKFIDERRAFVKNRLSSGTPISVSERKEIATMFSCTHSSVYQDIVSLTVDFGGTTRHVGVQLKKRVEIRDNGTCQYCGTKEAKKYIAEHVIPFVLGGVAREYNIVLSCVPCNSRKKSKVWIPKNLEQITRRHQDWKSKVVLLSKECVQ